jgi:hypothetical protein
MSVLKDKFNGIAFCPYLCHASFSKHVLLRLVQNIKSLNAELIPNCHLLAFLGAHHILHISRISVNTVVLVSPHRFKHLKLSFKIF